MSVILIDTSIIKCNKFQVNTIEKKNYITGLLIQSTKENIKKLNSIPVGNKRVDYVCSSQFKILKKFFIFFNEKRKIAIIPQECWKILKDVLLALETGFPKGVTIRVDIELNFRECISAFIEDGFHHPFITKENKIALIKNTGEIAKFSKEALFSKISHLLKQHENHNCSLWVRISKRALYFLHKICQKTDSNQLEMSGELFLSDVRNENGKEVFIIDINESSVESGEEENVNVSSTRYNFHSHPHQAYVNHSVHKAWPSSTDYVGYLTLAKNTIFHIVTTLEGIYIISMSEHWGKHPEKVSKSFVNNAYNIDHSEPYSIEEYVKKINKIKFKNYPVFVLQFLSWKESNSIFKVHFSKIENSCIVSQDIIENFSKFVNL